MEVCLEVAAAQGFCSHRPRLSFSVLSGSYKGGVCHCSWQLGGVMTCRSLSLSVRDSCGRYSELAVKYQFFLLAVTNNHPSKDPSLCVLDADGGLFVTALIQIQIAKNCLLNPV